jgi:AraC family transcriptional regulator, regulatory protein of adaptative response / DNA-3-methyladenine glycosylase II
MRRAYSRSVGPFEYAVRAIFGQQVNLLAGCTLTSRLVARFGRPISLAEDGLSHLFPTPEALAGADLGGLGLTTARSGVLRALARAVADGELAFNGPAEEVTVGLAALPGIGVWTANTMSHSGYSMNPAPFRPEI